MKILEFTELVLKMREAQQKYFKKRDSLSLKAAKDLEKKVDAILQRYKNNQKESQKPANLFDN